MEKPAPVSDVSRMRQDGMSSPQIARSLEEQGYNQREISDALNQSGIKAAVGSNTLQPSLLDEDIPVPEPPQDAPPARMQSQSFSPSPTFAPSSYMSSELGIAPDTEELVESVVQEKWSQFSDTLANMEIWKARMNDDMMSVKQELLRLGKRFDALQLTMVGKVDEYSQNFNDLSSELKAMEKVFKNIMEPLTSNIKELNRITDDMKGLTKR